jgi:hypothetical protein
MFLLSLLSFVQLQEEKEKQYSDLSTRLEDLQKAKQAEVGGLHAQCERLHSELAKANKVGSVCSLAVVS